MTTTITTIAIASSLAQAVGIFFPPAALALGGRFVARGDG